MNFSGYFDQYLTQNFLKKSGAQPEFQESLENLDHLRKFGYLNQMHLHWFAPEDEGRTEEPTEQKIRKAQEEGRFAKSSELTGSITMLFGIATLGLLGSYILRNLLDMLRFYFSRQMGSWNGSALWQGAMSYFLGAMLPLMFAVVAGAVLANLLQTGGFHFSVKPIEADLKKIAPNFTKWFMRSFGWPEGIFNLGKTLGKVSVVLICVYASVWPEFPKLIMLLRSRSVEDAIGFIGFLIFKILLLATVVFIVIAILDYIFQRRQYLDSLKMTKHEIKDELKQTEGDPLLRSQIRRRMRELLQVNLGQSVPQADVVVTNPTHFSVALQWDRNSMEAPMVSAKGADEVAFRIRHIARENNIPIMENKPLARGLYDNVDVGEIIPEQYWEVVSRILAEVYRMKGNTL